MRYEDALERLGRRLRARRIFLQLPLAWTAEQMGFTPGMLTEYENGRSNPPALTLKRMAGVLGTSCSDLLGERRRDNDEDVERALALMAIPAIARVANAMWRMDAHNRRKLVLLVGPA